MRTIGVEEELLLVDGTTGAPVPVADLVLQRAVTDHVPWDGAHFTGEMQLEMLEVITRPHSTLATLGRQVLDNRALATRLAAEHGALAAPLASSPLPVLPHLRSSERYDRMVQRFGAVPRHSLTCGLHVHVAVASDREGVAVLDRIRTWLPVFIALTANSPFHAGEDTGHASFRSVTWNQWPTAGPAERYGTVARYRALTDAIIGTEALLDQGMLYFDARLSRNHPTVEVRVADVPLDPTMTVTVAGIVRALVDTAVEEWNAGKPAADTPACIIRLANWRAAIEGLDGHLVDPLTNRPLPAHEVILMLLEYLRPALTANGDDQLVERAVHQAFIHGNGATRQRAAHAVVGDLGQVAVQAAGAQPTLIGIPDADARTPR
ncbi:carboxylate-amine ligase [Curtobacterium sp. VKM Ac-1376]|uniref:carboxylate-amine ligase n=1 Tax=Curtobacterium sp. VKM Ac-1376 TaxID=123312 RepID=UPI00188A43B0|nr:glutamate--cysteine ligase [Curtobacterium sp. VKM Ac-1376]MBF4613352.1 glutamate--cysteine ligase [Curtobacterium sp. VKM Ac-1376]